MHLVDLLELMQESYQSGYLVLSTSDASFDGEISGTAKDLFERLTRKTLAMGITSVAVESRSPLPVLHITLRTYFEEEDTTP